jgi:molybdopterin-guanine dinucleotide biosynthesis adapter protein
VIQVRKVHIVGRQNNGKTTLMVELVKELTKAGVRVGTIKHSQHNHELDRPGKDSFRHREAGSSHAAITTARQVAVFMPRAENEDPFALLESTMSGLDLVLVEGGIETEGKKVEVWRAAVGTEPLHTKRKGILAVITDDEIETNLPVWPRKDIKVLVENLLIMAGVKSSD